MNTLLLPADNGRQLKIATVEDQLSHIRTCFAQAGLPALIWPEMTRRFLRAETTIRRASGKEAP